MTIRDMVARHSDFDETGDFVPTPPWATRALYEYVAPSLKLNASFGDFYDPACGHGHMMQVAKEYGHPTVMGSDFSAPQLLKARERLGPDYKLWHEDYIDGGMLPETHHTIVSNPPYKHLNEFIDKMLDTAMYGVGILCRVQALEGEKRWKNIYTKRPPTQIAFFSNRIPFKTGAVVQKAPKMFFHVWLWWEEYFGPAASQRKWASPRPPMWIPYDAQTRLEKDEDYAN